jgi:hypothetical protein
MKKEMFSCLFMLLLTRIAFGQAVFAPVKDAEWPPVPLFMVQRNDSVFVLTDKGLTLSFVYKSVQGTVTAIDRNNTSFILKSHYSGRCVQ